MSYSKILFGSVYCGTGSVGRIGGGARLNALPAWPIGGEDGLPMLPLVRLGSEFFAIPTISEDFMLTVFLPQPGAEGFSPTYADRIRCGAAEQGAYLEPENLSAKVLLHEKSASELRHPSSLYLPPGEIGLSPMTDEELDREIADEVNGIEISKQFGREHWLNDPLRISPRYHLIAQLNEADLAAFDPAYRGIFNGGIGYLYLDYRIKKLQGGEAGLFFIQYPKKEADSGG
ncbi:hypothetical protein [Saccharibacillus alkalitolerans]|uniref:DUF1963 domain-containing protein n=1 Tax=Saccharibacillus alkalitolerans TaxID=2705290 RepID=A0ABX0FAV2_9BACL|nr:hypothetical protein [Saccharibacillus alkalitolerans]NGZ77179.1 hypothetical protein [Saccharibacillus alkalitolerans]